MSAPCILTHGVLNALSVFAPEPEYKTQCIISRILIVLAAAYAAYLLRKAVSEWKKTPRGIKP